VLPEQLGLSNAGPVAEQLLAVLGRGADVLIADMTVTRTCDSAGTDALVRVFQQAVAQGTDLRLVIPAPVIRRVVALSGLDQLVPVFAALGAAQGAAAAQAPEPPPAVVLPLRPRSAAHRPAVVPVPIPDGPRPVTRLPVASSASPDGLAHDAQQDTRRQESQDTLAGITDGIFHAGLTLEAGLGQPADGLRQAAEHTLDLLDKTVRQTRDAAFAGYSHAVDGLDDVRVPEATGDGLRRTIQGSGRDAVSLSGAEALRAMAAFVRARSRQLRTRSLKAAVLSADSGDQVAAIFGQLAASYLHRSAERQEHSQAAASHATRLRQWVHENTATG